MDRSVFLKCPSFFFSLSCSHRLSSFLHTSRAFVSFPYLATYAFLPLTPSLSSVLFAVLFVTVSPPRSYSFFLRLLLHHRFAPRAFHAFSRVALCVSPHLYAYLTFVLLLCICAPLCPSFLPAASEACIFRSLQYLLGSHISMRRALKLCTQLRVLGTRAYWRCRRCTRVSASAGKGAKAETKIAGCSTGCSSSLLLFFFPSHRRC